MRAKPLGPTSLERLESLTDADRERWQLEVMPPGSRCWYVVAVAVAPQAQSRGVGAALLAWGTTRADDEDAFCWVHSSETGFPSFARAGFLEQDHLTVDLDEFASHPRPPGEGASTWGTYTFRYLRRPAVSERLSEARKSGRAPAVRDGLG